MPKPRCFGIQPDHTIPQQDAEEWSLPSRLRSLQFQDWCREQALLEKLITTSTELSYADTKANLLHFFSKVENRATDAFVKSYAKKCRQYFTSKEGATGLKSAHKKHLLALKTEELQEAIREQKTLAELEGKATGIRLARLGAKEYDDELEKRLASPREESSKGNAEHQLQKLKDVTEDVGEEERQRAGDDDDDNDDDGEANEEVIASVVALIESNVEEELPGPLRNIFFDWMYALVEGKSFVPSNALETIKWNTTYPRDILNHMSYVLLSNFNSQDILSFCTLQLSLSHILNAVSEEIKEKFEKCFEPQTFSKLTEEEETTEEEYDWVRSLSDDICKPWTDKKPEKVWRALQSVMQKKNELQKQTKDSPQMQILDMYEYILRNLDGFLEIDEDPESTEADFHAAMLPIFQILFRHTKSIKQRSGECASTASTLARKKLASTTGLQTTEKYYGRKIDTLFITKKGVELCAAEWKKKRIQPKQLWMQQTKNLRVTKCIMNEVLKLPIRKEDKAEMLIYSMDWRGFAGYISSMEKKDGIFVAKLKTKLHLPLHGGQMPGFKDTLISLLKWKDHLEYLADMVDAAKIDKDMDKAFAGVLSRKKRSLSPEDSEDMTYFSPKRKQR